VVGFCTAALRREINVIAPDKFETVFSSQHPVGMAVAGEGFTGEVENHAYWGSMRDRIPASAHDSFAGSLAAVVPAIAQTTSARRRLRLPENLAMIRSGQDWRACGAAEREYYLRDVHPVLIAGMDFLRGNSEESGCLSCRFMTSVDEGSSDQVTFGSALFRDLADLEVWAEKHPTHVAIFGAFLKMVRAFNGALDLRLWHEVIIVDGPTSIYEYLNCTPETGALRWLECA
jgi:aldoxime dehydratase